MVQAARILSAKLVLERLQRHRHAVIVLALQRAKKIVRANIRAKGQRIADFSAREIAILAEDYLAQHRQELMNVIATSPSGASLYRPFRFLDVHRPGLDQLRFFARSYRSV